MEQAGGGEEGEDHLVANVHSHQADLLLQDATWNDGNAASSADLRKGLEGVN
jgi:hypothetical protein